MRLSANSNPTSQQHSQVKLLSHKNVMLEGQTKYQANRPSKEKNISYTNLKPNYLFEVSQEHFPDFIESGPNACTTTVQCLCKKFRQLAEKFALSEGRLKQG
jgi:hypothetical protein